MDNGHGTSKASKKVNLLRVSTNSAKTYRLEEKFGLRCLLQQLATFKTTSFSNAYLKVGHKKR